MKKITTEDKLNWVIHNTELEGYTVSQETNNDCAKIINNELSIDDAIERLNKKYNQR